MGPRQLQLSIACIRFAGTLKGPTEEIQRFWEDVENCLDSEVRMKKLQSKENVEAPGWCQVVDDRMLFPGGR